MVSSKQHLVPVVALAVGFGVTACSTAESAPETVNAGFQNSRAAEEIHHLGEADRAMKTARPEAPAQLHVTNIRCGSHPGFDRVVFDLSGDGDPGWFTDYTDTASQLGSGKTLETTSPALLNVYIDGTVYPHETDQPSPKQRTEGTGAINEIISAGTVGGRSHFVIGLAAPVSYSVTVLEDPKRLVIDFVAGS